MDYSALQQAKLANTYVNRGLALVRGEGAFLYDEKDRPYLDLMSNYGVNVFGYHHPVITAALTEQLGKLTTLHASFANDVRVQASFTLVKRCGPAFAQVYWSNSGAEAIEAALKFAVLKTGKKRFIVCDHGYHGKTLGALSATAGEKYKKPFEPLLWDFVSIPFQDTAALTSAITSETAAFILEPIQGEGGIYVPSPEYLAEVRRLCDEKNILLIIDEIQTGVGRTGAFLASHHAKVSADIVCLGKGLAGGIPVGATVFTEAVGAAIPKHIHTSTFGGNPLACAGVLATLSVLDENILQHVSVLGERLQMGLRAIVSPWIGEVRGQGLMIGVVVKEKRNQLLKLLQDRQVLVIPAGEDVVRLLPPFVLSDADVDRTIAAFQESFAQL
jgi:acetylornithine/LysW-gamma-L-lysine aminotransferase